MADRVKDKMTIGETKESREMKTPMEENNRGELVELMKWELLMVMIEEDQDLETKIDSKIEDRVADNSRIREEMKETLEDE